MAKNEIVIEALVHEMLRKTIQAISTEYGFTIHRVEINWLDLSSTEEHFQKIERILTQMSCRY